MDAGDRQRVLRTGQIFCYDSLGLPIDCAGTGQDAESAYGLPWPSPRFQEEGEVVADLLTGLSWSKNANPGEFPRTWDEAFAFVRAMNTEKHGGFADWRLPNRRELISLMSYQAKNPSLPRDHPFVNVFLGWYWTATSAAIDPRYAWYVHLEGARMFYGRKDQYSLVWPVRGGTNVLSRTGQEHCYDQSGTVIDPVGTGQDGELRLGRPWPAPRFSDQGAYVVDGLTGLRWLKNADLTGGPVTWAEALAAVRELNRKEAGQIRHWRLPNINALESLVDCSRSNPALPEGNFFRNVRDTYWSATTSFFETDWAWALYLDKGALGVGYKKGRTFFVWPVSYGEPLGR
ncbi:Lcl C-terminal domain-containing protein [Thiovibrio sp. JS02]